MARPTTENSQLSQLRRAHEAVAIARGIVVHANDGSTRVDSSWVGETGSGKVHRGEGAVAQQEAVHDAGGIDVGSDNVALGVIASIEGEDGAGKIDGGEGAVIEKVSV